MKVGKDELNKHPLQIKQRENVTRRGDFFCVCDECKKGRCPLLVRRVTSTDASTNALDHRSSLCSRLFLIIMQHRCAVTRVATRGYALNDTIICKLWILASLWWMQSKNECFQDVCQTSLQVQCFFNSQYEEIPSLMHVRHGDNIPQSSL